MKNQSALRASLIALIVFLGGFGLCRGQSVHKQEELSQELATFVRSKWDTIELDAKNEKEEWAGSYRSFDGPTITTHLTWSSRSGFTVWWENCSRPWLARVNYGSAELRNGSLRIIPQLAESIAGSFTVPSEFVPVRWGAQHFLIPSDQLVKFAYAVNSGSISEIESFLLKIEDYGKQRKGLPKVPPAYTKYLRMKPIIGVISGFGPKVKGWHPTVILNVGKSNGVVAEMKFYFAQRGKHFMVLEVTSVQERTAEASVFLMSTTKNGNQIEPKAGWRVSSRAPKDSWKFMP